MLERVITAIGQSLARGGRSSIVKSLNVSLATLLLGMMGLKLVGIPEWIIGLCGVLLVVIVVLIAGVYVYGIWTRTYDILRSEFFLLSKIAAQKQSLRGDDLKTFMKTIGPESSDHSHRESGPPAPAPGETVP